MWGGAILWWGFRPEAPKDEYITTVVKRGNIIQSVDAVGEVFARNLVDVGAQVSGQIKELYVKVGDRVKAGDRVAQIDSIKQQNTLNQQLAALCQPVLSTKDPAVNKIMERNRCLRGADLLVGRGRK